MGLSNIKEHLSWRQSAVKIPKSCETTQQKHDARTGRRVAPPQRTQTPIVNRIEISGGRVARVRLLSPADSSALRFPWAVRRQCARAVVGDKRTNQASIAREFDSLK